MKKRSLVPPKSLVLLGLCTAAAILAGIGRFAFSAGRSPLVLDAFLLVSVVATLLVSMHIVARALSREARDELYDIERSRRDEP